MRRNFFVFVVVLIAFSAFFAGRYSKQDFLIEDPRMNEGNSYARLKIFGGGDHTHHVFLDDGRHLNVYGGGEAKMLQQIILQNNTVASSNVINNGQIVSEASYYESGNVKSFKVTSDKKPVWQFGFRDDGSLLYQSKFDEKKVEHRQNFDETGTPTTVEKFNPPHDGGIYRIRR